MVIIERGGSVLKDLDEYVVRKTLPWRDNTIRADNIYDLGCS
jgi:hypothetical protein